MRKTSTALLAAAALTVGTTLAAAPAGALTLPDLGSVTGGLGSLSDLLERLPTDPGPTDPDGDDPENPGPEAPGEDGPRVTVDADGPYTDGQTVTVSGEGFSGQQPGLYVGLIEEDRFDRADAEVWMSTEFVRAGEIVDGKWSAELDLPAVNENGDCTVNSCSIYTVVAHGSSDESQDTQTPVSFE